MCMVYSLYNTYMIHNRTRLLFTENKQFDFILFFSPLIMFFPIHIWSLLIWFDILFDLH